MNEQHKSFAIHCFNEAWTYMDKKERTTDEDMTMIHLAHASRYHWGVVGTPLHAARGDWQISRVYSLLDQGENALIYANASLCLCLDHNFNGFDLAFGYEAVARSLAVLKESEKMNEFKQKAVEAAMRIDEANDRQYVLDEIDTIRMNEVHHG